MRRKNGLHIELRVTRIAHRSPATGTAGSRHEHSRDHRYCPRSVAEPESDLSASGGGTELSIVGRGRAGKGRQGALLAKTRASIKGFDKPKKFRERFFRDH